MGTSVIVGKAVSIVEVSDTLFMADESTAGLTEKYYLEVTHVPASLSSMEKAKVD